jgi:hypothetical protein
VNKATKENLTASLEETKSTILRAHDEGATISAQHRALVVPTSQYRQNKMTSTHGLRTDARLPALLARASAKRSVRIKNGRVFVAMRGAGLKLAFVLKQAITQKADVPITQTFNDTVTRYVNNHLIDNLTRILRASHFIN